jgi:hypothetical protein
VLGQIPGNQNEQLVESIEIGDLSMGTKDKTVKHSEVTLALKEKYGTPVRRFRTPWFRGDSGFFYVDLAVVGPKAKKPEGCLPLGRAKVDDALEAISHQVELLKQKLR